MRNLFLGLFLLLNGTVLFAQVPLTKKQKKALLLEQKDLANLESNLLTNYKYAVNYLASDALEGRRTGTAGADSAVKFIANYFEKNRIAPRGSNFYLQKFIINEGIVPTANTNCSFNNANLQIYTDWLPLTNSGQANINTLGTLTMKEYGMPWFYDVNELFISNKNNPHFLIADAINTFATNAIKLGCKGLLLYNSMGNDSAFNYNPKEKVERLKIPVIYLKNNIYKDYIKNKNTPVAIKLVTNFEPKIKQVTNVIGFINNNAATTVVIGAHYDHLGHGEDKNSRYTGTDSLIHNGADDNASGTAGLLALATQLKNKEYINNNYLFIAFSGEELGLLGSKYFTDNPTINLGQINYMINMDMIGRLNDSTKTLTIGGFGTSPAWPAIVNNNYPSTLNIKIDSSGTGPSDHTSFYRKDIPVLFFFTGLHSDYHMPSDDADKINYPGAILVLSKVLNIIKNTDKLGKLTFTKTKETQMGSTNTRFKITLGIMPDYSFTGEGVKADGVTDGKPAKAAGVLAGDIITQIGANKITGMETYMKALSELKKGDNTTINVLRANKQIVLNIKF